MMAPVGIKYVVSFTSQDDYHKVNNLTSSDGFRKWLSHPKDKSGQIEAVFQLDHPCVIDFVDTGVHWCSMVEIQVGCSDWPQDRSYLTLVPTVSFMNPLECRNGSNPTRTRMFGPEEFSEDAKGKKWDRIKVICRQPFRKDVQFGICFLRIRSKDSGDTKSDEMTSPTSKSVKSIQKHFFGKSTPSKLPGDGLKSRLLKIAGSSENGTEHHDAMPRTAKLVLAASEGCSTPKAGDTVTSRPALYSSHLNQKYGPQFEEEVTEFLATYKIEENELDKVTIADIRHKFEKMKKRKLTVEEKKVFVRRSRDHICSLFGNETSVLSPLSSPDSNGQHEKPITPKGQSSNKYGYDWKGDTTPKTDSRKVIPSGKNMVIEKKDSKTPNMKNNSESVLAGKKSKTPGKKGRVEKLSTTPNNKNAIANNKIRNENDLVSSAKYKQTNKLDINSCKTANSFYEADALMKRKPILKKINGLSPLHSANPLVNTPNKFTTNNEWLSSVTPGNHGDKSPEMSNKKTRGGRKRKITNDPSVGRGKKARKNTNEDMSGNGLQGQGQVTGKPAGRGRKNSGRGRGRANTSVSYRNTMTSDGEITESPVCHSGTSSSSSPLSGTGYMSTKQRTLGNDDVIGDNENSSDSDCILTDTTSDSIVTGGHYGVGRGLTDSYSSQPEFVECPVCCEFFSKDGIEFHASICCELNFN